MFEPKIKKYTMKRFNLLSMVIVAVLMVALASCTTMREGYDDEYYTSDRNVVSERIYVDDPYRGTIVLERDPYSGRYYQVSPIGGRYNQGIYDPYYRNNYYRNQHRNTRPVYQNPPRQQTPSPQQQQENQRQ